MKVPVFLHKYYVDVPSQITYFGYTFRVKMGNNNSISLSLIEMPRNVKKEPVFLKEKLYYYLQAEDFIDENVELL